VPAVNQIELHPHFQQTDLRAEHATHGIATEAWSPLGQGAALSDATITRLAKRHNVTPAQVALRWHLQLGNIVIPKWVTPARIRDLPLFRIQRDRRGYTHLFFPAEPAECVVSSGWR
jgi:diketogulonate reductase-like aldo/keto reductase